MAENDTSTDASAIAAKAAVDKVVADKAAAVPTYDDKQTAHINKIVNEAYGKAFEKASGILSPQIKALQDQIAALAPKPDAAAAAAANGGDKSHEEVARLNARLIELQGIAEENKRRSSSSANRFASFSRESTRLPNRAG